MEELIPKRKYKKRRPTLRRQMLITDRASGEKAINAIIGGLGSFFEDAEELTKDVVLRCAMMVISESNKLVPRDTQALAESWGAHAVETQRGHYKAIASYGGGTRTGPTMNAPNGIVTYAVQVHEDLEAHHNNGQAKFLEDGAQNAKPRIEAEMIAELRSLLDD